MWALLSAAPAMAGFFADPVPFGDGLAMTGLTVADFDGDGLSELLGNDPLSLSARYWFGRPLQSEVIPGSSGFRTAGDFDGDGVLDLMVGQELRAFAPGWPVLSVHPQAPMGTPVDFDLDGDLDLVYQNAKWWENLGGGTAFLENPLIGVASTAYCSPGDVDLDGDPDLVCAESRAVVWYEGDGTGFSWVPHQVAAFASSVSKPDVLDFDSDGVLDALALELRVIGGFTSPVLWLLPGDPSAPSGFGPAIAVLDPLPVGLDVTPIAGYVAIPGSVYPMVGRTLGPPISAPWAQGELVWLDWDGDGAQDELLGSTWTMVHDGLETGAPTVEPITLLDYVGAMGAADANGDGLVDLSYGSFFLLRQDALGTTFVAEPVAAGLAESDWGDFDQDGLVDVLSQGDLVERDPSGTWSSTELIAPRSSWDLKVTMEGDLDGDGDPDVVSYGWSGLGGLTVWTNDGTLDPVVLDPDDPYGAALGDVDGDGDLDVVAAFWDRETWFENRLGGTVWVDRQWSADHCAFVAVPIEVVDLDQDGDPDVLMSGPCDRVYERTGATHVEHYLDLGDHAEVADLDLDGDLDLLTSEFQSGVEWLERQSPAIVDYTAHVVDADLDGPPVALIDLDDDGDQDFVAGGYRFRNDATAPGDDPDSDGIAVDNCPDVRNPDQLDLDLDLAGDACDCAPDDPARFPGNVETCDAVDQDCDLVVDDGFDLDTDGRTTCGPDGVLGTFDDDCADDDAGVRPGLPELPYDGLDQDCNPATPDDDLDRDGFGIAEDCADLDASVHPAMTEVAYDGRDQDCDPGTPDDDLDGDGFGIAEDCADQDASVGPLVAEVPYDGIDQDCDAGTRDDDLDADGFVLAEDCADEDASVNPGEAEAPYDGVDQDCDPGTPDDDLDGDGFVLADDCADDDPDVRPDAAEVPYDGVDQDCDPATLDDDLDGDGFGLAEDCADDDPDVRPDAAEVPYDGVDQDCDPATLDDDLDRDGFVAELDCADDDPEVRPDAAEVPYDGVDQDCDPATPDDDLDGDGFPAAADCADADPDVSPGAPEVYGNAVDDDCDPATSDAEPPKGGCGCRTTGGPALTWTIVLLAALVARRRAT